MYLPKAKQDNLVQQNLDKELLIYDLETNEAFSLNETSAIVFNACNGQTTFTELKARHQFTDDLIFLTLDELKKQNLLLPNESYQSPFSGMSRRTVVKKVGLSTMIALPLISSVVAPTSTSAASGLLALGATCTSNSECASGLCTPFKNTCCVAGSLPGALPPGFGGCTTITSAPHECCSGIATVVPGTCPDTFPNFVMIVCAPFA